MCQVEAILLCACILVALGGIMFIAGQSSAYYASYSDAITVILLLLIASSITYCAEDWRKKGRGKRAERVMMNLCSPSPRVAVVAVIAAEIWSKFGDVRKAAETRKATSALSLRMSRKGSHAAVGKNSEGSGASPSSKADTSLNPMFLGAASPGGSSSGRARTNSAVR